jgi:F-type H+-transporting ATPase subunit b
MLIDWFTVGAQALNFVVLVWLLKRFLYKPILRSIDSREKLIATELSDADAKKADAEKERDALSEKNKTFDEQRAALMGKVESSGNAERERLLGEARKEADALRAAQTIALRSDRTRLEGEIRRLAGSEVFEIARKALADLASVNLEERIGEVFTQRLRQMDSKTKEGLSGALRPSPQPARVTSTFEIGASQRKAIQNALNETFSAEIPVRFDTSPEGICGIELTTNGQKISWNIGSYLSSLEQKLKTLVDAQAAPTDVVSPPANVAATSLAA